MTKRASLLTATALAGATMLSGATAPTAQDNFLSSEWGKNAGDFCFTDPKHPGPSPVQTFLGGTIETMARISPVIAQSLERLDQTQTYDGEDIVFCGTTERETGGVHYTDSGLLSVPVSNLKGSSLSEQEQFENASIDAAEAIHRYHKTTNGIYFGFDTETSEYSFLMQPVERAMEAAYVIAYAHQADMYGEKTGQPSSVMENLKERPGYTALVTQYQDSTHYEAGEVSPAALRDVVDFYLSADQLYLLSAIQVGNDDAERQTLDKFNDGCQLPPAYKTNYQWFEQAGTIPGIGNVLLDTVATSGSFAAHLKDVLPQQALIDGFATYLQKQENFDARLAAQLSKLTVSLERKFADSIERQMALGFSTGADCTGSLYGQTPRVNGAPVLRPGL